MHFLSHYYVSSKPSPYYVAGLMLPDIVKGFSKIYNKQVRDKELPEELAFQHLQQGILFHYETDRKFHNSVDFMQQESLVLQSYIVAGLDRNRLRLSVLAHLAVEMMIDRQIVAQHPDVCSDYYSILGQVDESVLKTYLVQTHIIRSEQIILTNFQVFKQKQFLFQLTDVSNLVAGLLRIYTSVTGYKFLSDEREKFVTALNNIDEEMRYSWNKLLKF